MALTEGDRVRLNEYNRLVKVAVTLEKEYGFNSPEAIKAIQAYKAAGKHFQRFLRDDPQ
jgi:hypothetical protein